MRAFADVSYDNSRCWGNDQPATFWAGPDFVTTFALAMDAPTQRSVGTPCTSVA